MGRWTTDGTDGGTVAAAAPARRTDLRHGCFLGAGCSLWAGWQRSTASGLLFGATTPSEWELDFAVPLSFIALPTLLLRERAGMAALYPLELTFPT